MNINLKKDHFKNGTKVVWATFNSILYLVKETRLESATTKSVSTGKILMFGRINTF